MEPCPRVGALQFLKGDPVDVQSEIDKGKTVVIELFATWCGPCHQSIPHVTELQKQFPDVIIIGVSTSDTPEVCQRSGCTDRSRLLETSPVSPTKR